MNDIPALISDLYLRPLAALTPKEYEAVRMLRNEPAVRQNMYQSHPISTAEHAAWLCRIQAQEDHAFYAVIFKGSIVGAVILDRIDRVNKRTDWAFYLGASAQGHGLGSALEFTILDLVFFERDFEKLNCEVLDFNTPVIALHEKFGFRREGIRRRHILRNGEAHDAVLLGITRGEWQTRRPALAARYTGSAPEPA